eukprot:12431448-Karenia_brevis.AAC.3
MQQVRKKGRSSVFSKASGSGHVCSGRCEQSFSELQVCMVGVLVWEGADLQKKGGSAACSHVWICRLGLPRLYYGEIDQQ